MSCEVGACGFIAQTLLLQRRQLAVSQTASLYGRTKAVEGARERVRSRLSPRTPTFEFDDGIKRNHPASRFSRLGSAKLFSLDESEQVLAREAEEIGCMPHREALIGAHPTVDHEVGLSLFRRWAGEEFGQRGPTRSRPAQGGLDLAIGVIPDPKSSEGTSSLSGHTSGSWGFDLSAGSTIPPHRMEDPPLGVLSPPPTPAASPAPCEARTSA